MHFIFFVLFLNSAQALRVSTTRAESLEVSNFPTSLKNLTHDSDTHNQTPKIAIFFTTSGQGTHMELLASCWPRLMRNKLPILSQADIILHSNGPQNETELRRVMAGFPNKIARIAIAANPGWQLGAIQSMAEAVENSYFKGYDWVIRVNPDVLILKEENILNRMTADRAGIFANCHTRMVSDGHGIDSPDNINIHTDFYAVRPNFLVKDIWVQYQSFLSKGLESPKAEAKYCAETFVTQIAFRNILEQRLDSWIVGHHPGQCRIMSEDLLHNHHGLLQKCFHFAEDTNLISR